MTKPKTSKKTICAVAGCGRPVQTSGMDARAALLKGLCRKHYLAAQSGAALGKSTQRTFGLRGLRR